jgi:hypothetical protein
MSKLFEANDLDASAAIDMERADALRQEAAALVDRATEKRARAAGLRREQANKKQRIRRRLLPCHATS